MARLHEDGAGKGATRGRPRDPVREAAILAAARALIAERGYEGVSIEAVAARAGVGKQTVYRRWPGKADLLLAAFRADAEARVPVPDAPTLEAALDAFLRRMCAGARAAGPSLRALMAQAQIDPDFRTAFDAAFVAGRRAVLAGLVVRHLGQRGAARADLVVDMVYGAIWYRLLLGHRPLSTGFAADLASAAAAIARAPATRRA